MKKIIPLFAACLLVATAFAADQPKPPVLQFRLVLDVPSSDSETLSVKDSTHKESIQVEKKVLLDETALKSAQAQKDSLGHPQISITLTDAGRKQFADITRQNVGKRLAIVVDGQFYSAPVIRTEIPGGKAQISGNFTEKEARELAKIINDALKPR